MESNRNKEDIVVSRIVITRVVCSMNGNSLIGDFDLAGTGAGGKEKRRVSMKSTMAARLTYQEEPEWLFCLQTYWSIFSSQLSLLVMGVGVLG